MINKESFIRDLRKRMENSGIFAETSVKQFIEIYGVKYYTSNEDMLSVYLMVNKGNASHVYETEDTIYINVLTEFVININKNDYSYKILDLEETMKLNKFRFAKSMQYVEQEFPSDYRIMEFAQDLKRYLQTLTIKDIRNILENGGR